MDATSLLLALTLSLAAPADEKAAGSAPRTGDFKDDYRDPASSAAIRYRLRAPAKLPARRHLGLIICFHGLNGNEDSITGFAIDAAARNGLADQYVIAGGKSKGNGWEETDDQHLLPWIAWVKRTYPIDPRRVHLIGMSNGGWMVNRFGWKHQGEIATVTDYCGPEAALSGVSEGKAGGKAGSPADTRCEWYVVHGDADDVVRVDSSRLFCRQLRNKGYRYIYREIKGGKHVDILQNREVADDVMHFLHATRQKELALAREEQAELASLQGKAKAAKAGDMAAVLAEAQRVGGAPGGRVITAALSNSDAAVKTAALETCLTTAYGREVLPAMVKLLKDKSEEVKAAAYRGLAAASALRYPEAQDALVRAARNKKTPLAERLLAVAGLGKTVKLQFLGNFEDKAAIWALVLLLDDADEKVRHETFAQLEKLVPDTFQYRPDLPAKERRAAVAKWTGWISTRCGPYEQAAARK
jgi:hypothetical protein